MTLLDRIHQLQLRAVAADDEDKIRSRSGEFITLRERFATASTTAARVDAGRKELYSTGILQIDYEQNRAIALAVVNDLINFVENLSVEAKFDAVKIQGNSIVAHFKSSEKLVADAWRSHLPSAPPAVDDELLDALEQGGVDVEAIRSDIENAKSTLLTLRNRTLPQLGDNDKLQKALDTLSSSGERIGELIDPAIANLVVRAQGGGVLYSEMTTEVILALTKLGILDRFRVVLK
jgi:hypothetical protein